MLETSRHFRKRVFRLQLRILREGESSDDFMKSCEKGLVEEVEESLKAQNPNKVSGRATALMCTARLGGKS